MTTWITLSVIALLPMLLRTPKALSPLRVSPDDPSRLAGMFRRYTIHTFTGYASDVDKRGDGYTRGSINSTSSVNDVYTGTGLNTSHTASTTGSIDTEVVITDRFFLTNEQGQSQSFEGTGFEAQVGNGHLVSLVWVIRGRKRSGRYFLIYNHTAGEPFFNETVIWKVLAFPYPKAYVTILTLMILPIPVLALFGLTAMWQAGRFQSAGVRPLMTSLQSRVASLPTRTESTTQATPAASADRDIASALREIAALRDSGALSQEEFETAKAKLLAP